MRLNGSLILEGRNVNKARVECEITGVSFHDRFEEAFITLCKELDISVPIWLDKNTKEIAMSKKTSFYEDQFDDDFLFDRFEMRIDKL